jgi:hypothetical protein
MNKHPFPLIKIRHPGSYNQKGNFKEVILDVIPFLKENYMVSFLFYFYILKEKMWNEKREWGKKWVKERSIQKVRERSLQKIRGETMPSW